MIHPRPGSLRTPRKNGQLTTARTRSLPIVEALEDRVVLSSTPLSVEQLVNSTVSNDQRLVAVGANPNSSQVVLAWATAGQDGSGDAIYAQRYDRYGAKVGSQFRVNTYATNAQTAPVIAMDSLGSFVIAWQSTGQDGSGDGIYARRYGYDGVALAGEFRVNNSTGGDQRAPALAMEPDGDFVIAYQSSTIDGNGVGIVARAYKASGSAVASEFRVNQFSTGDQQAPSVAMDGSGNFIVAWQSAGQDGAGDAVVARRYTATGSAIGSEFVVNQFTTGAQGAATVAANLDGSFTIAWQSPLQDGNGDTIVARLYDSAGSAVGSEFIANTFTTGNQSAPSIATSGAGDFAIAWQSALQDGSGDAVVARTFSAAGAPTSSEFVVNSFTTGAQSLPSISVEMDGDLVIAWQSAGQESGGGTSLGTFVRRYTTANDAPVLKQISNQAIDLGGTVSFVTQASDQDLPLDTLTYSLGAGSPDGATIDPVTGQVTWTPGSEVAVGRYTIIVRVEDSAGLSDEKKVAVTLFDPADRSPLDDFVNALDPGYKWDIRGRTFGDGYVRYDLLVTSGSWRTAAEVNRTLWQHWVSVYVPDVVTNDHVFLFIDGGNLSSTPPSDGDIAPYAGPIAAGTGAIFVRVTAIPYQPLQFAGESFSRTEDSLIAYSWAKFLETGDPTWPANLPMTRGVVRSMDAVLDFLESPVGGDRQLDSFTVAGGSKRGWTTWLTAAVDPRVSFAVPIVSDLLNMEESFVHHYAYYNGTYSFAVNDYVAAGVLDVDNYGTDEVNELLSIVDPYTYKERLTIPKFILNASGDEFFVPDSWSFYYDDLLGPKWIRYVPNTGHGISDPALLIDAFSLMAAIISDTPIPEYSFTQLPDGTIELTTSGTVIDAKLWQSTNPNARDFRYSVTNARFSATQLTDQGGGVYRGNVPEPATGWTAYYIQITFSNAIGAPVTVSSGIYLKGEPTNRQPVLASLPDLQIVEGTPLNLPINAVELDPGQTLTYSLEAGAPAGVAIDPVTGILTGLWNDQTTTLAPITVVVVDNGSPVLPNRSTFRVTVINAAPTASVTGPTTLLRGEAGTWTFFASDPSPVDQSAGFTFNLDWNNDGIVDETIVGPSGTTITRTFSQAGAIELRVSATDKDGGASTTAGADTDVVPYQLVTGDLFWFGTSGVDVVTFTAIDATTVRIFESMVQGFPTANTYDVAGVTGILSASAGDDNDTVDASLWTGPTSLNGGAGSDLLLGGTAADTILGDSGNDTIAGGIGSDLIDGGDDEDLIYGESASPAEGIEYGSDTITGGDGNDTLYGDGDGGEGFADSVDGGDGDDTIYGDGLTGAFTGADTIHGGAGSDILYGDRDGAEGSADLIFGDDDSDFIQTGRGNDTADGGLGDDILLGGDGAEGAADQLSGGDGQDILVGDNRTSSATSPGGADTLDGGAGQDIIIAGFVASTEAAPVDWTLLRLEWTSTRSLGDRIANLSGIGVGPRDNGDHFLLAGVNLFNDQPATPTGPIVDQVLGGTDEDWILADLVEDQSGDLNPLVDVSFDLGPFPNI